MTNQITSFVCSIKGNLTKTSRGMYVFSAGVLMHDTESLFLLQYVSIIIFIFKKCYLNSSATKNIYTHPGAAPNKSGFDLLPAVL